MNTFSLRVISAALIAAFTAGLAPVSAFASPETGEVAESVSVYEVPTVVAEGTCGEALTWALDSAGTLTVSGEGAMTNYSKASYVPWDDYRDDITSAVISAGVTSLSSYIFNKCTSLSEVTIPEGVTSIGDWAFTRCSSLKEVALPESVDNIGSYAFYLCSELEKVTLPSEVTGMDTYYAFNGCENLLSVTLPRGITVIDENMFYNCKKLVEVSIPDTVTEIERYGFARCYALPEITLPERLESIGEMAFSDCSALREIVIPDSVTYMRNVYDTASGIFEDCVSLERAVIGSGIKQLDGELFMNCTSLREVVLPDTLAGIGEDAFNGCSALETIDVPDSVTYIGGHAFSRCAGLQSVSLGSGVTAIEDYTFYGCSSLAELSLPETLKSIGERAFWECSSLAELSFPETLESIGDRAFQDCVSLYELTLPDSLTEVGEYVFDGCTGLVSADTGAGLTRINRSMFRSCEKLSAVTLGADVTSLENGCFYGCSSLESIELPPGLTVLATNVFYNSGLKSVAVPETVTSIGTYVFPEGALLYVYPGSAAESHAADNGFEYEYIMGEKTSLRLLDTNGEQINSGYTVKWYLEGTTEPISTNKDLYSEAAEHYYAEICFDENSAFDYRKPQRVRAESGTVTDVAIEPIGTVTTTATIVSDSGALPETLKAEVVETVDGFSRTRTVQPDADGKLTFETANVTTTLKLSADGYYSLTKYPIVGSTELSVAELGELRLEQIKNRRIYVELTSASAVSGTEEPRLTRLTSFGGAAISVYDETSGKYIENCTLEYPYIVIEEDVPEDHALVVSARAQNTAEASAEATDSGNGYLTVQLTLKEHGQLRSKNMTGVDNAAIFIFDSSGALIQRIVTSERAFTSEPLPDGNYTVVMLEKNTVFANFEDPVQLDAYGLKENTDYIKKEAEVSAGSITDIGDVSVPKLDLSGFSYTVDGSAKVEVNRTEVTTGNYVTVKVSYEINDSYPSENERVTVSLPENVNIADGSLTLDGKYISYTKNEDGDLVIPTGKPAGSLRFYVSADEEGSCRLSAALSFESGGNSFVQSLGTAAFYAAAMFITAPSVTASETIRVSGSTRANAEITLYDGNTVIGTAKANAKGSWLCAAELDGCLKYTDHAVRAVAEFSDGTSVTSRERLVFYDPDAPEVSKVTMHSRGGTVEFDFKAPSLVGSHYSFWYEYPAFTFTIEFTKDIPADSEVYLNIYGNMDIISVKAEYDETKKLWLAALEVEQGFLPVNVEVAVNGYSVRTDEQGALSSAYSYSVDELNAAAGSSLTNPDLTGVDTSAYEALDPTYGIYRIDGGIAAMENGYVTYTADEIGSLGMGLENEVTDELRLDDGTAVYLYSGSTGGLYVSQIIADRAAAQRLSSIFDQEYVNSLPSDAEYIAFTTVLMLGIAEDEVDAARTLFAELGGLSAETAAAGQEVQLFGIMDNIWDAASEVSEKLYAPSQLFVDWLDTVNKAIDLGNLANKPDLEKFMYTVDSELGDYTSGEYETLQSNDMYEMYKSIDVNSPYFQEATEVMNSFDKFETASENIDTFTTAAQFLANIFDRTQKIKDGIGIFGQLSSVADKGKTAVFYEMMRQLAEKEQQRKNGDSEDGDTGDTGGADNGTSSERPDSNDYYRNYDYYGDGSCDSYEKYSGSDSTYCIDPSGYVCEAVPSNLLEGVTTTIYYLDDELDEFGMPTGNKVPREWNAEDYDQANPLITDANGRYAWDVPEGQWQVKFEKDGYETQYSEWLPVPPPQTEVNMALVSTAAPAVESVTVYEDKVKLYFTQYMDIGSASAAITVYDGSGAEVGGTVSPINNEPSFDDPSVEYASGFEFTADSRLSGNINVTVDADALNYAGTPMGSPYRHSDSVRPEPTLVSAEDIELEYGSEAVLAVQIGEPEAGAGLSLTAVSSSPSIVSVVNGSVTADSEGKAYIRLKGELPGESEITVSVDGTELSVTVTADSVFVSETMTDYAVEIAYAETPDPSDQYIAALYDENGVMLACKTGHPSGAETDTVTFRISGAMKERIDCVKTFVWDSLSGMTPTQNCTETAAEQPAESPEPI